MIFLSSNFTIKTSFQIHFKEFLVYIDCLFGLFKQMVSTNLPTWIVLFHSWLRERDSIVSFSVSVAKVKVNFTWFAAFLFVWELVKLLALGQTHCSVSSKWLANQQVHHTHKPILLFLYICTNFTRHQSLWILNTNIIYWNFVILAIYSASY